MSSGIHALCPVTGSYFQVPATSSQIILVAWRTVCMYVGLYQVQINTAVEPVVCNGFKVGLAVQPQKWQ